MAWFPSHGKMPSAHCMLLACVLVPVLGGCAAPELHRDQGKLRQVVLDLYTDQIIDNLVRAKNGLPFIHIDYATITGNVTVKETAALGGNQEGDSTKALNVATALFSSAMRAFKTVFNYSTGGENTNQVSMVGTPVNNVDEIYEAYFEYLNLPDALLVSNSKPPDCNAHLCKKFCGNWYWIPVERKKEFLQLAMATTATRGKRMVPLEEFYPVQLLAIASEKASTFAPGAVEFILRLDKSIPNDDGRLELGLDKNTYSFLLKKQQVNVDKIDTVTIAVNPNDPRYVNEPRFKDNFKLFRQSFPYAAKIYLERHRPQPPTVKELIEGINNQLEIIKLNQLR